ncbi:hypothetical protein Dimus_035081 [Dionaea muscipula]
MEISSSPPPSLSPTNTFRRSTSPSNSPEFEFWMLRNPSLPPPHLLSADQLFSGGFLLPLHLLNPSPPPDPLPSDEHPAAVLVSAAPTVSKRWKDIFRKKLIEGSEEKEDQKKEKSEKRRERKNNNGGSNSVGNSAELIINMNLWPFSRSRSAGNNAAGRPRSAANRKVSSAPCSRSNSAGDSKSRKWPNSPARTGGVHLGRTRPIWQARRVGSGDRGSKSSIPGTMSGNVEKATAEKVPAGEPRWTSKTAKGGAAAVDGGHSGVGGVKSLVLNLTVPMCIGYRSQTSCTSNEISPVGAGVSASGDMADDGGGERGSAAADGGGDVGLRTAASGGNNIFTLRSLFTKKVTLIN